MRYRAFIFSLLLVLGGSACAQRTTLRAATPGEEGISGKVIQIIEQGIRSFESQRVQCPSWSAHKPC